MTWTMNVLCIQSHQTRSYWYPICLIDQLGLIARNNTEQGEWWIHARLFHVNFIRTAFLCAEVFAKNRNTHLRHVSPTFTGISVFMSEFGLVCLETWFWISTGSAALFIKAQISMERRQISSLPVLKDCWSRTTHPNPYLFPSLTIVRFGHHPPSALGFRCRFGTQWWMNPWLLDLGPKQRVSYLVIPCESPLYGLALGCLSWIDTARLRTLFAST